MDLEGMEGYISVVLSVLYRLKVLRFFPFWFTNEFGTWVREVGGVFLDVGICVPDFLTFLSLQIL